MWLIERKWTYNLIKKKFEIQFYDWKIDMSYKMIYL